MMKDDTFQTRRDTAGDAKKKLLDAFRTATNDPAAEQRKAERRAVVEAREVRMRVKAEEERRVAAERAAEEARLAAEREEQRLADEAAREAARPSITKTAAYALATRTIADLKLRQSNREQRDQSRKSA